MDSLLEHLMCDIVRRQDEEALRAWTEVWQVRVGKWDDTKTREARRKRIAMDG